MALATQCPHCHTTFKVAHDQLKLRAGLVRCGACRQIFNGIENLRRPDDQELSRVDARVTPPAPASSAPASPAAASPVSMPGATVAPTASSSAPSVSPAAPSPASPAAQAEPGTPTTSPRLDVSPAEDKPVTAVAPTTAGGGEMRPMPPEAANPAPDESKPNPLHRMTLIEVAPAGYTLLKKESAHEDHQADAPDPLEKAIEDLERKPMRSARSAESDPEADALDAADNAGYEEPSFVTQGRRRQRYGQMFRMLMWVAAILLAIGLLAQLAYIFRSELAARLPRSKPAYDAACSIIGCQVGLPARIDAVSLESSELQASSPEKNIFALTALLRNQSSTVQAWPYIELTLNDAAEKPIGRKVFAPRDYLASPQDINKGLAPKSEQSIQILFELSQLKASGYRVYLFYP